MQSSELLQFSSINELITKTYKTKLHIPFKCGVSNLPVKALQNSCSYCPNLSVGVKNYSTVTIKQIKIMNKIINNNYYLLSQDQIFV